MANVLVQEASLRGIADVIRLKNGTQNTYKPAQMAEAIAAISGGGGSPVINPLSVTKNGTYTVPSGVDGYSPITVNVPTGGSGGSGGTEVTASVACTNALDCVKHIFPTREAENHLYVAYLKNKSKENFQTDQLVGFFTWGTSSWGIGVRWRNSGFNNLGGLSSSYEAKIAVGDVFETYDISYA